MKLRKLSLILFLKLSVFTAQALSISDIDDFDITGVLRSRYDLGSFRNFPSKDIANLNTSRQEYKYKGQLGFMESTGDDFKVFLQLNYESNDASYGPNAITSIESTVHPVKQIYINYNELESYSAFYLGRYQLNTLWTDNDIDGVAGAGLKVVNTAIPGITLAALFVDSFDNSDKDLSPYINFEENFFATTVVTNYETLVGNVNTQFWLGNLEDTLAFYALDYVFDTNILNGIDCTLEGAYLGNYLYDGMRNADKPGLNETYVNGVLQPITYKPKKLRNGNFFALRGSLEMPGLDFSLGGLRYGSKKGGSVTTIEDQGNLKSLLAGEEIFYSEGSRLTGDYGLNTFAFVTAGITLRQVFRVGGDLVYGGTQTGIAERANGHLGGLKMEVVARAEYRFSPKFSFSGYYSRLVVKNEIGLGDHRTVRVEALYKF